MAFDPDVRVGEIRIFADAKDPLTALVLRDRGLSGFRLVPVSPYRVPISDREVAVGERVFQIWNVCTAARRFAARSWRVDELGSEDVERIRCAVAESGALPSRLGDYERRQLTAGGDFVPWSTRCPAAVPFWHRRSVWSIAASVLVGLGVTWMLLREERIEEPGGPMMSVRLARQEAVPELESAVSDGAADGDVAEALPVETKVDVPFPETKVATLEPVPEIHPMAKAPKMAPSVTVRAPSVRTDSVVAAKTRAGSREAEVVRLLEELKGAQRADGSWGEKPLRDTALAVIALMAHGEKSDSPVFGRTLVDGVRWLSEAGLSGEKREDVQVAACALCCASVAVPNPNIRLAAERTLATIGDNRSIEAGRDWSGILADLTRPAGGRMSGLRDAAIRPGGDSVADACVLVLKLLKK